MSQEVNVTPKKKKFFTKRNVFIVLMLAYPIIHFLIFWVYVNFNTFILSFQRWSVGQNKEVFANFDNYARFFKTLFEGLTPHLQSAITNSIWFLVFNNFILLPVSIVCSYLFFKKVFGHQVFRVIFFLPNIISVVILTMAFRFMFNNNFGPVVKLLRDLGLSSWVPKNGFFGTVGLSQVMIFVYCLWAGIGYNVLLLSGSIARLPQEVLEAGYIDGIGMWKELTSIIIPMIFPTISTLFITGSMVMFTLYLQPMLLTSGGPNGTTYTIAYYVVDLVNNNKLYDAAAAGIVFSIIGVPMVQLIKWGMEKITPQIEF
jgi:multiple sugar transport system permease protein/N-acetylglucosamine transport system permease protein